MQQNAPIPKEEYPCQNKVHEEKVNLQRTERGDMRDRLTTLKMRATVWPWGELRHISGRVSPLCSKKVRLEGPSSLPSSSTQQGTRRGTK